MDTYKVLIVEDEKLATEKLERQLLKLPYSIEIIGKTDSIASTVAFLNAHTPSVIFLDIQLADGISFDIFEKIDIAIPIIFTTAYDEYALQAFKVNSVDYLLKPVSSKELENAFQKFEQLFTPSKNTLKLEALLSSFQKEEKKVIKQLLIQSGENIETLKTQDVAYFFAEDKYCFAVSFGKEQHLVDKTLEQLSKVLEENTFYRANRKYIINRNAVKKIVQLSKSKLKVILTVEVESAITISQEKNRNFKEWLMYE